MITADSSIKLSVIVPCYKVEKYLPACLDSLINQTLDDIEIICINDGSPDGCIDILRSYEAANPGKVVVIDKKNEGVWRGRFDGIRIAKGEYIGFVDSDDTVAPNFAEVLYRSAKVSDADISVCGFKRIDLETNKVLSVEMCSPREDFVISEEPGRLIELNGAPWNKAFRSSILKSMNDLEEPPTVLDDLAFHLLVYLEARGKVVFSDVPLINYMVRADSSYVPCILNAAFQRTCLRPWTVWRSFIWVYPCCLGCLTIRPAMFLPTFRDALRSWMTSSRRGVSRTACLFRMRLSKRARSSSFGLHACSIKRTS